MKTTLLEKEKAIEAIGTQFKESSAVYFIDFMGLTVEEANDLRKRMRDEHVFFKVFKNTFICRAIDKEGINSKLKDSMIGPTALAACPNDEIAPARLVTEFAKKQKSKLPRFKVALVNGQIIGEKESEKMATMPGRKELIGMLANGLQGPIVKFAGTLQALVAGFAYAISAV